MDEAQSTSPPQRDVTPAPLVLLNRVRSGDSQALGPLLKSYSSYLTLIARMQIGKRLQAKLDEDDVVQETFLEAHRQFPNFRGTSEGELTAWLRTILAGQIALALRRYLGTQGRDMHLERELNVQLDQSSRLLDRGLVGSGTTPSQNVSRREQSVLLSEALERLPADYREVIVLRHLEQLSFADVSAKMNRSGDSVQKLWVRALKALRQTMVEPWALGQHPDPSESPPVYDGDDPRVDKAVHEYMEEIDAGRRPSRKEFLARYPEIADELSVCLQGLAFLDAAAAQIKEDAGIRGPQEDPILTSALASAEPLGDFRLVREIGRGGMGIVYEAFQMSLGRTVALKVLPMAAALDPRQLQRFHNEAQAAAQLHHTNIVPVYAVGCERSVHYYAMQLIEGKSIAEVIRALREKQEKHGSKSTTNSVTELSSLRSARRPDYFRYVANLAVQAARALDYAHQIGVVHRDIKPANLLFDWRGTLWITDFGLAQIYSEAPHNITMPGDVLGTLRYMSPEQASGSGAILDGRTDIYSLGVTLYELLTLEHAVAGDSRQEMLRRIAAVDPIAPRWFDKRIPIELETIVMKAIAKEPRDRYATARAMAEDLERFLRHEPIRARRPTTWDQASKWVHRHWHLTASVLIILMLATVGLSVSTIYISREKTKTKEALDVASASAWEASRAQIQASQNFAEARQAVEFMTRIASDEMPDDPRLAPLRRRLLETSLSYYQNFLNTQKRTHADADLAREQAQINELLAKLTANDQWAEANYQLSLLAQSSVAGDLQLTTNQRMSIRGLSDSDDSWDMFNPEGAPPPDMRPPRDPMQRGPQDPKPLQQALRSILTVRQMDRLQQISRQLRGPAAFADVEVASALSLTPLQKSAVQTIRTQTEQRRAGPPGNPDADRTIRIHSGTQEILKQLTPEQQHIWSTLIGEPFHGYVESRERRPGPPPPQW